MTRSRILSQWTAVFLATLGLVTFPFRAQIEAHHLSQVLNVGYDAFGRNCFLLTLCSMVQTLISLIPVTIFCFFTSIAGALFISIKNEALHFTLKASLDLLSALPGFLLALALGVLFPGAIFTYYLGAILMVVPALIRFFESQLLRLASEDFVLASGAMGASKRHIWGLHYLPALMDSILTILPFTLLRLILIETSLSFLGLSVAPEHETWGRLLAQGKDYFLEAPWILVTASLPLCLLIASFHLLSTEEKL
jgi:peptide/nickel transport system permease protein